MVCDMPKILKLVVYKTYKTTTRKFCCCPMRIVYSSVKSKLSVHQLHIKFINSFRE